jgi:hypothetical protein
MSTDPIEILKNCQGDPRLGHIAAQALHFLEGIHYRVLNSPGPGQSPHSVVRMYEVRKTLKNFRPNAFVGLQESINSLQHCNGNVHLVAIETEKGFISLWVTENPSSLQGVVIAGFV